MKDFREEPGYIKPTKAFRLNGQTKRIMATITDAHARGAYKRAMIQAQIRSEIQPPRERKSNGPSRGAPGSAPQA